MAGNDSVGATSDHNNQQSRTNPKDALVMASILKEMGVSEYEPRLINQMLEFSYRYTTDVLEDARVYSLHASKKQIDQSDVVLAVERRLDHSFTAPPPREFLLEVARTKNSQPLPLIQDKSGLRLPPDRYCLTGSNYRMRTNNIPQRKRIGVAGTTPKLMTQASQGSGVTKPGRNMPGSSNVGKLKGNSASHLQNAALDMGEPKLMTESSLPAMPAVFKDSRSVKIKSEVMETSSTVASLPSMEETAASAYSQSFPNLLKRKRDEDVEIAAP